MVSSTRTAPRVDALLSSLRDVRRELRETGGIGDPGRFADLLTELEDALSQVVYSANAGVEFDLLRSSAMLLARAVSEEEILSAMLDGLQRILPYDAAGVYLVAPESPLLLVDDKEIREVLDDAREFSALVVRGYDIDEHRRFRQKFSRGVVGWVISHGTSAVVRDVRTDSRYIELRPETLSEITVPIISRDTVIGAINLEADRPDAFPADSVALLENLASYAAVALERAQTHRQLMDARGVEKELEIAREIQTRLLPEDVPHVPKYEFSGLNVPSELVGGDYYDFVPITGNDTGIVIADVAGKGFAAGLVMASLRSALRMRVETTYSIRTVMANVNRFLYDSTGPERYVTAFYGVLDHASGTLTYVNAGHNPPLLLHADGRVVKLSAGGPLLAVLRDANYQEAVADVEPGAILVLYTDGIVEAGGELGEEFGEDRVVEIVQRYRSLPAPAIAAIIEREAVRHHGDAGPIDDRTVIVVKHL